MYTQTQSDETFIQSQYLFIDTTSFTIKGLELDVVLQEKLHGHALSRKVSLLLLNRKPTETEKPLRLSAVRWNAEVFPRQPLKSWNFWPPWPQRQVHLLPRYSHQSPLGLGGLLLCCRVAPIFCEYSSAIFLEPSEYGFLVCRLYGDYPAKECHH